MKAEDFKFVKAGNWFSEYKCIKCGASIVTQPDGDLTEPEQLHNCEEE